MTVRREAIAISVRFGDPSFSYDGTKLTYASNRSLDIQDYNIYMMERACVE